MVGYIFEPENEKRKHTTTKQKQNKAFFKGIWAYVQLFPREAPSFLSGQEGWKESFMNWNLSK